MLRILQLEAVERTLARSSELSRAHGVRDARFPQLLEVWLLELETLLQNTRLPAASTIAAVKTTLQSVRDGAFPAGLAIIGRSTARKRLRVMSAEALRQAVQVLQNTLEEDRGRFREAERIALQLLAVVRANGLLVSDNAVDVRALIAALKSSESTAQGMAQLEGLTGPADAIIVLDRMLSYGLEPVNSQKRLEA